MSKVVMSIVGGNSVHFITFLAFTLLDAITITIDQLTDSRPIPRLIDVRFPITSFQCVVKSSFTNSIIRPSESLPFLAYFQGVSGPSRHEQMMNVTLRTPPFIPQLHTVFQNRQRNVLRTDLYRQGHLNIHPGNFQGWVASPSNFPSFRAATFSSSNPDSFTIRTRANFHSPVHRLQRSPRVHFYLLASRLSFSIQPIPRWALT